MTSDDHEKDFTPEEQFEAHFAGLVMSWIELGIDPDDFLKCALCRELTVDPDNDWKQREHCKNTVYIIRTPNYMEHARVTPAQGGFEAADREAKRIRGRLYGLDIEGHEVRLAYYDRMEPR